MSYHVKSVELVNLIFSEFSEHGQLAFLNMIFEELLHSEIVTCQRHDF
jgi:hypothetical protein